MSVAPIRKPSAVLGLAGVFGPSGFSVGNGILSGEGPPFA